MLPNCSSVTKRPCARTVFVIGLSGRYRLASDLAGRVYGILGANCPFDFGRRDVQRGELVWIDPDPKRILARLRKR